MKPLKIFVILALLAWSCQEEDLPKANFDLDAVTVFTGTAGHEKVDLSWEAPANNSPQEYILKSNPDGLNETLESSVASYEVKGLSNGKNYSFSIQAVYGDSEISGMAEVDLTPIDQLNFTALPGNELIIATWNTPLRDDIAGYTLTWADQEVDLSAGTTVYQITDLTNDTEYDISLTIEYNEGSTSSTVAASATPGEVAPFLLNIESPMSTEEVLFTYNSAFLPHSTAESWSWDFGDGTTSSLENPAHIFSMPGIYEVSLEITDDQELTFSGTQEVYVWGEKWSFQTGSDIKPSSPAIADDGTIYIGSYDNKIYALNPDGTLKWSYTTGARINTSPAIGADGTIYCGSDDDSMHALNPDGSLKWSFPTGSNIVYSTPAIASDGTIYFGSDDDKLYALNSDGTLKWEFVSGDNVRSSPAIGANGTVYAASDDDNMYAINPNTGAMLWSFLLGGNAQGAPAIDDDGTVIIGVDLGGDQGVIFALNPDGTEKWSANVLGRISVGAPSIANGNVYVGTKEGNNMLSLDKSSGAQNWSYVTDGAIVNSSAAVDVNGVIYYGSWDDGVYALNPDGTLKYRFPTDGNVWSSPAIGADGTIYIGSYDGKIYALEMFAEGLANDTWPMFGKDVKHMSR